MGWIWGTILLYSSSSLFGIQDYLVLHLLMLLSPFNHALIIFFERSVSETTSLCFVNGCRSRSSSFLIIVVASFALYIDVAISL